LLIGTAVLAALGLSLFLAWKGHNPLLRIDGPGGGVEQYGRSGLVEGMKGTAVQLGVALLLQFHVALVWLFCRRSRGRESVVPLVCFGLVYVIGLTPFPATSYNMRYFIPLFPLVAWMLARGAAASGKVVRRSVLAAQGLVAITLVLVFNVPAAYRAARPWMPQLAGHDVDAALSLLDNLRMKQHLGQKAMLDDINSRVPGGATLYLVDFSYYYGDAPQGVLERSGMIHRDITTRYVSRGDLWPGEETFYVWSYLPMRSRLASFGMVTGAGPHLYRVQRPTGGHPD
jgi:hypothetical protein